MPPKIRPGAQETAKPEPESGAKGNQTAALQGTITIFTDPEQTPLEKDITLVLAIAPKEFPVTTKGIKASLIAWKVLKFKAKSTATIEFPFSFDFRLATGTKANGLVAASTQLSEAIKNEQEDYFELKDGDGWAQHPFYHPFETELFLVVNNSGAQKNILIGSTVTKEGYLPYMLFEDFAHKVACMVPPAKLLRAHESVQEVPEKKALEGEITDVTYLKKSVKLETLSITDITAENKWLLYTTPEGKTALELDGKVPECPPLEPLRDLLRKVAQFIDDQIPLKNVDWARKVLADFGNPITPQLDKFLTDAPGFKGYDPSLATTGTQT